MSDRRWIRIVHCRDIPLREGRVVQMNGREIAIFNLGDRFMAVQNQCPHRGGPLADGIVSGMNIVCPLHAWKFNLENGNSVGNSSRGQCLEVFPTRVRDGTVLVQLSVEPSATHTVPTALLDGETGDALSCSR